MHSYDIRDLPREQQPLVDEDRGVPVRWIRTRRGLVKASSRAGVRALAQIAREARKPRKRKPKTAEESG